MAPDKLDQIQLYYTYPLSLLMTLYSIFWFIKVWITSRFRWVKFMLFLCVVQNVNTTLITILAYVNTTDYKSNHKVFFAIITSISIFLNYFVGNLMYWLYGFKYWVISIEIPGLIAASNFDRKEKHKKICSEARYRTLGWVGILINLGFCLWLGWKRG